MRPKKVIKSGARSKSLALDLVLQRFMLFFMVPDQKICCGELNNQGITIFGDDCGYVLAVNMSDEIIGQIIENTRKFNVVLEPSGMKLATANFDIQKIKDKSGEPAFIVLKVLNLAPVQRMPRAFKYGKLSGVGSGS